MVSDAVTVFLDLQFKDAISKKDNIPDDYVVHAIYPARPAALQRQILVHTRDGNTFDLAKNPWLYTSSERSVVGVTVAELADNGQCRIPSPVTTRPGELPVPPVLVPAGSSACSYSFTLVRPKDLPYSETKIPPVFVGFVQVPENTVLPLRSNRQVPIGLEVTNDLWHFIYAMPPGWENEVRFTLNGMTLKRIPKGLRSTQNDTRSADTQVPKGDYPPGFIIPPGSDGWRVELFPPEANVCRQFPTTAKAEFVDIPRPVAPLGPERANGIVVGAAKIYDVLALRKMLSDTANQLSSLVGFNSAAISGALTNIQGIARDTSYLNAQIATLPTNGISAVNNIGSGTNNQTVATTPLGPGTTSTAITLQCPDGTVPNISSGAQGCAATPGAHASTATLTNLGTTNAAASAQTTDATNTALQNNTTTTTPSVTGQSFIPAVSPSTALTPPTNIGLSSADILTDQVNLNAQITTLRLLLQGALSDQYVVKGGKAVASRQQTTLGFTVSLDPPRQYKHAVAEVRVVVSAPVGEEGISIMNLLPSEKTYNVAKVTSSQKSFGVGVIKTPIGLGVNAGRAKDRLYLAKDTDTLALQFPSPDSVGIGRPIPVAVGDFAGSAAHLDWRDDCDDDRTAKLPPQGQTDEAESTSVVFGWQFRPVLGESYVKGGQRQVFAQLALPASLNQHYVPRVHIQTRWRAYDPKKQVVGATYYRTCSWSEGDNGVIVLTNPSVDDVKVTDIGAGQVRLTAKGEFFSSGATIVAGTSVYAPTAFDGRSVQFIGRAVDLMQSDELTIVGPNGQHGTFGIPVSEDKVERCNIERASLVATPYPDGISRVVLDLTLGSDYFYDPEANREKPSDGKPSPLVLIGSQVYGLRDTPFGPVRQKVRVKDVQKQVEEIQNVGGCVKSEAGPVKCVYSFIAPTSDIRNAQTFLVRDLAWSTMRYTGTIHFMPSLSELARITPAKPKDTQTEDPAPKHAKPGPVDFSVKGFDLQKTQQCSSAAKPKLPLAEGAKSPADSPLPPIDRTISPDEQLCVYVPGGDFEWHVLSPTVATLRVSAALADNPTLRLQLMSDTDKTDWTRQIVWDLTIPKDGSDSGTVSTVQMHRGDSGLIVFKGTSFKTAPTVTFDKDTLEVAFDAKKNTQRTDHNGGVTKS
jgi:hypothetical protein